MRFAFLLLALAGSGCTTLKTSDSGRRDQLASRPSDCEVRFYRLGPPQQSYEEIGSALVEGTIFVGPAHAEETLKEQACQTGADAVVITSETYGIPMFGCSVKAVFIKLTPS